MARPTKLDNRTQNLILVGIRLGLTYEDAAKAAGVHPSTFYRWVAKGNAAKSGRFCEFCESLTRAKAEAQLTTAKVIFDAAKGGQPIKETRTIHRADGTTETIVTEKTSSPDWRAAALILERRFPEEWGRKDAIKVEVDWRAELQSIGVDPDEALNYTTELLRAIADGAANPLEGSDDAIEV